MNKKWMMAGIIGLMGVLFTATVALAATVPQTSVLGGTIVEVTPVGTTVKEGDALVSVETIGGPMVAARATVNGVITSVSVAKGDTVEVGQSVAVVDDSK